MTHVAYRQFGKGVIERCKYCSFTETRKYDLGELEQRLAREAEYAAGRWWWRRHG